MRLELKLAFIGAVSKLVIFLVLFLLVEQSIDMLAQRHTDRDLLKMKDKTMAIIRKSGIKAHLDAEQDSTFASYNILKDEFIQIQLLTEGKAEALRFTQDTRIIEEEEFDYRILNYTFVVGSQLYMLEIGKNMQMIYNLDRTLKNVSIVSMLVVLFVTILFDLGIFKYLLQPLNRRIIPKLRTVVNPESFAYTALDSSTSDFVYLNNTINELMHKVNDILKSQKKFIGDVSHELFTPISVMQTKLDNLLTSEKLPAKTVRIILDQQKQLVRLQHIIKAFLLISRIENDQYARKDVFLLKELTAELTADIEERATIDGITIEDRIPADLKMHDVNKYLIYTLLFNLVSNAIKYNKIGGTVILRIEKSPERLCIVVEDTGIGIREENIPLIFNRFKRIEEGNIEGQGLGLSIVNSIAAYHDATIKVISEPEKGSQFRICFSLKNLK